MNRLTVAMIGVLLVAAFALRLIGLGSGLGLDEFASIEVAVGRDFSEVFVNSFHFPAYFLFLNLWSNFGTSEALLAFPSALFSVIAMLFMMLTVTRHSLLAVTITGAITAVLPIVLRHSVDIRHYSLLMAATAGAFYYADKLMQLQNLSRKYLLLLVGCIILAVATHGIGVFMVLPVLTFMWMSAPDRFRNLTASGAAFVRKNLALFGVGFAALVLICGWYFFQRQKEFVIEDWWMPPISSDLVSFVALTLVGTPPLVRDLQLLFDWQNDYISQAIIACGIGVGVLLLLGEWRRGRAFLAAAFLYVFQIVLVTVTIVPLMWPRLFLPMLVPMILFLGVQLATIRWRAFRALAAGLACVFVAAYTLDWVFVVHDRPKEVWKPAAEILRQHLRPKDLVVFYPGYTYKPIEYYFPMPQEQVFYFDPQAYETSHVRASFDEMKHLLLSAKAQSYERILLFQRPDSGSSKLFDVSEIDAFLSSLYENQEGIVPKYLVAYSGRLTTPVKNIRAGRVAVGNK